MTKRKTWLVETIKSDKTRDLIAEGTDTVIDVLSDSDVIGNVPIAGWAAKTYQALEGTLERRRIKKLENFLVYPSQMTPDEKSKFSSQFEDPNQEEEFGEQMLVLIEQAEDTVKPKIIGRLLVARVKGHFDQNTFMRLCKMVDRAFVEDFHHLSVLRKRENHMADEDIEQSLSSSGFLRFVKNPNDALLVSNLSKSGSIVLTQYGKWLVDLGLSEGPIPTPE